MSSCHPRGGDNTIMAPTMRGAEQYAFQAPGHDLTDRADALFPQRCADLPHAKA